MFAMCRSINTVGQGAFYTETFCGKSKVNIVYDCGSLHNTALIQSTIEDVFEKGEEIAAVVISHFDEDHINGLEHLLTYCSVKNLFLPLIQEQTKALLLLCFQAQGISRYSFLYSFILNPESVVGEHTRIIYVKEFDDEYPQNEKPLEPFSIDDEDFRNEKPLEPFSMDDDKLARTRHCSMRSGTPFNSTNLEWVYIPFNYRDKERHTQLKNRLGTKGIPIPKSASEVPEIYLKYSKKLKEAYLSIAGSINTNSMVMYSGPLDPSDVSYYLRNMNRFQRWYAKHPVGCLYTGDGSVYKLATM